MRGLSSRGQAVLFVSLGAAGLLGCSDTSQSSAAGGSGPGGSAAGGSPATGGSHASGGGGGTTSAAGRDAGSGGASAGNAGSVNTAGVNSGGNAGGVNGGSAGVGGRAGSGAGGTGGIAVQDCNIAAPTHWAAGVYVANCDISVTSTLTIDPGAVIKFGPGFHLSVGPQGTLTAIGTEAQPIVFTSLKDDAHGGDVVGDGPTVGAKGDWGCREACADLNIQGKGSALQYVQALYGSNGVYIQGESAIVSNSTFAHHTKYGLVLDGQFPVETTQLTGNAFFDNGDYPLVLGKVPFVDASNTFHDPAEPNTKNAKQCILVDADIDRLSVLGVLEVAFLFSGHHISAELLTQPGVIFKSQAGKTSLDASGSLANGPNIIFTSYKDDSVGGDCTGDGPTAPAAGDWEGLWVDDGSAPADFAAPADYIRYAAKSGTMSPH